MKGTKNSGLCATLQSVTFKEYRDGRVKKECKDVKRVYTYKQKTHSNREILRKMSLESWHSSRNVTQIVKFFGKCHSNREILRKMSLESWHSSKCFTQIVKFCEECHSNREIVRRMSRFISAKSVCEHTDRLCTCMSWFKCERRWNYISLLQKSPIKEMIFCKRVL